MTSLLCCKCAEKNTTGFGTSTNYLLPGGEWDPNVSSSAASDRSRASNVSAASRGRGRHRSSKSSLKSIRSLLTGGGWRGRQNRARSSFDDLNSSGSKGEYQPPPLLPSKTLPTIDEFKLLRTVGKGAFGKVCFFCVWMCLN